MALGKLLRVVGLSLVGIMAALMLVRDPFLQIFAVWLMTQLIIKTTFQFQPHPLKMLTVATVVVLTIHLSRTALNLGFADGDLASTVEKFIVDWGGTGAPMKCGGNMEDGIVPPTHTAVCDIWSDPEKIVDQRVDRVLESTMHEAREMEDFLHVDQPDMRERTKTDQAESLIV